MKLAVFFCIVCMFAACSAQAAPLYRWVDTSGKVHYTDQPPPPSAASKVEEKTLGTPAANNVQLPNAARLAAKNFPVPLYNSECGETCTKAREHLTKRGIPFNEKNAGTPEIQTELMALIGALEVPVLAIGTVTRLKGYEPGAWNAALDEVGYPKNAPFLQPKLKTKVPAKVEQKPVKVGAEGKP